MSNGDAIDEMLRKRLHNVQQIAQIKNNSVDVFAGTEPIEETQLTKLGSAITVVKETDKLPVSVSFFIPNYVGQRVVNPATGEILMGEANYTKVDYVCIDTMPPEFQALMREYVKLMGDQNKLCIINGEIETVQSKNVVNVRKRCAELLKSLLYVEQSAVMQEELLLHKSQHENAEFLKTHGIDDDVCYGAPPAECVSSDDDCKTPVTVYRDNGVSLYCVKEEKS